MDFRNRNILDLTHDLILELEPDGSIRAVNQPLCLALGIHRSRILGQSIHDFIADTSREELLSCLDTAHRGVPVHGSFLTLLSVDRRPLPIGASFFPPDKSESPLICAIFRSLSVQEAVRHELRESEKKLRAILSAIPDAVIVFDRGGRYRQIYTGDSEMLIAPATELLQRNLADVLSPEEARFGVETIERVIVSRKPADVEYPLKIRDRSAWFSGRVVPFGSKDDPCVLWVARDITYLAEARKQSQEDQKLLRSLLELETKAREVVAYEIHDGFVQHAVGTQMWLQTPLQQLDQLPESTANAIEVAVQSIHQAVEDARSMIRDLRPVVLGDEGIADGIQQLILVMLKKSKIPIRFHCHFAPPLLLKLLESQVFRIVQESLNNAIRHSQASSVDVALSGDTETITVEISDDGIGFDPKRVASDRYGLEGIQRRASVFGGSAHVISEPGKGTRIRVHLPVILRQAGVI